MMQTQLQNRLLMLPTCKGIEMIDINSIVRIEASSNYSKLYFSNGKTLVAAKVLRWFEEKLSPESFFRIHKTHLVNKSFIRLCYAGKIRLTNNETIDVSKRKKICFLKWWYAAA